MVLKISDLSFDYKDGVIGLDNVNFEVKDKNLIVVLGESGSGKTTLAKAISGVITPKSGRIILNDEDITDFITASRDLTMVFQNFLLYPHMTIYENVMVSLNGIKLSEDEKDKIVKDILTQFGLGCYLNFKPRNLSDGQKQRVAICKALVRQPYLFILDEPLANLDSPQRKAIRKELKALYEKTNSNFLYITHDIEDAEFLSTFIVIMDKGRVLQTGTLTQIRERPKTLKAAKLIFGGLVNVIEKEDGDLFNKFYKRNSSSKEKVAIPYKSISIKDNGEFCGRFLTAKITPKGIQLTLLLENDKEIYILIDEEDINYKENDIIRFDVVNSFSY